MAIPIPYTAKYSWFFEDFKYGWSETLYLVNTSTPLQDFAAQTVYATKRLAMCGKTTQLTAVRISVEGQKRAAVLLDDGRFGTCTGPAHTGVPGPNQDDNSDRSYSVFRYRVQLDTGGHSVRPLGGIPFGVARNPDDGQRWPPFEAAWQAFRTYMKTTPLFSVKSWILATGVPWTNVVSWTPIIDNPHLVNLKPGAGLSVGDRIRVRNSLPTYLRFNHDYTVKQIAADGGAIVRVDRPFLIGPPLEQGQWHLLAPTYPQILDIEDRGFSKRSRGRPFDEPRGRARRAFP